MPRAYNSGRAGSVGAIPRGWRGRTGSGKGAFPHTVAHVALALTTAVAAPAFAAGTGMPWESTLDSVLNSLTGPVLRFLIIMAIVAAGVGLAFTEGGTMLRRSIAAVFGLSIAAAAVS